MKDNGEADCPVLCQDHVWPCLSEGGHFCVCCSIGALFKVDKTGSHIAQAWDLICQLRLVLNSCSISTSYVLGFSVRATTCLLERVRVDGQLSSRGSQVCMAKASSHWWHLGVPGHTVTVRMSRVEGDGRV